MRRFQKMSNSVALLIVAVLCITSFARGTLQLILFGVAFLTWGIYAFISFLLPIIARQKQRRELRRISEEPQKRTVGTEDNPKLKYLLLCHVNHRITGYIKSADIYSYLQKGRIILSALNYKLNIGMRCNTKKYYGCPLGRAQKSINNYNIPQYIVVVKCSISLYMFIFCAN